MKAGDEKGMKNYYLKIADDYDKKKEYDKAIEFAKKAGDLGAEKKYYKKIADSLMENEAYQEAAEYYKKAGDEKKVKAAQKKAADKEKMIMDYGYKILEYILEHYNTIVSDAPDLTELKKLLDSFEKKIGFNDLIQAEVFARDFAIGEAEKILKSVSLEDMSDEQLQLLESYKSIADFLKKYIEGSGSK